jgi:hypothetical protein
VVIFVGRPCRTTAVGCKALEKHLRNIRKSCVCSIVSKLGFIFSMTGDRNTNFNLQFVLL